MVAPDIDLEITCRQPDGTMGFAVVAELAPRPEVWLLGDDHPGPHSMDLVEPMRRALTDETRIAILELKERLQTERVPSIDVDRAVLEPGVRTKSEFRSWYAQNASAGLTSWRPAS